MEPKDLLLSHYEASKISDNLFKEGFDTPHEIKIVKGDQELCFLGSDHTDDPDNSHVKFIEKRWQEFLKEHPNKEDVIVFVEGGTRPVISSADEAIKRHGEPGLMVYLAHQAGVKFDSPEPQSRRDEIRELLKKFPEEEVAYYYFIRDVVSWLRRKNPNSNLDDFINRRLEYLKTRDVGWHIDITHESMICFHNKKFGHQFGLDDKDCFESSASPYENPVASACSHYRDAYIVAEIKKYWDEGKSIFVVYGMGHSVTQEPALKELLK